LENIFNAKLQQIRTQKYHNHELLQLLTNPIFYNSKGICKANPNENYTIEIKKKRYYFRS
jgi:hypothetical protein